MVSFECSKISINLSTVARLIVPLSLRATLHSQIQLSVPRVSQEREAMVPSGPGIQSRTFN
jgi:hypothetical protein